MLALVIAYFTFRKGLPSMVSTPIKLLFGASRARRREMPPVLGSGILAVRSGAFYAFEVDQGVTTSLIILAILFVCYKPWGLRRSPTSWASPIH